ncbi:MAG: ATP-binding protein [Lentisphaeria bacterium]|nr:ATP-binding protein [Lentisphaeria bacterium]
MYIARQAEKLFLKALKSGKIVVLTGARQVGKTTLVQHVLDSRRVTMLNFDVPFDVARFKAAAVLPPADGLKTLGDPEYLVIDEAQREPDTARIVKWWYDSKLPVKIILLGSSALNLLSQTTESLTGRNRKLMLPPMTVREMLAAESWYNSAYPDTILDREMAPQFRSFLLKSMVFGCYPEVITSDEKMPLLRNLAGDYLWKDILQLGAVKSPDLIRRLLVLLAYQTGSEISVNEISSQLTMARQTVERYLDLLEEAFVIFRLNSFSSNPRKEIAKGKKIFFWDTGIRNAILNQFDTSELRPDIGALFENYLIAKIMKRNVQRTNPAELYFWRSRGRAEVDLVLKDGNQLHGFEIKWSRSRKTARTFEDAYKVAVQTLTSLVPSEWPLNDAD